MSQYYNMTLAVISSEVGPISADPPPHKMGPDEEEMDLSFMIGPNITATHTWQDAPKLDMLWIPGGIGNYVLELHNDTWVEDFVAARYPELSYLLSVCTGSVSIAKSGVADGKKATTNKGAWQWVTSSNPNVTWVPSARWIVDGNIWTSSGVAAGEFKDIELALSISSWSF